MFLGAAALYGVGFGAGQPALLAMTADRVPPEERGRAMGTLYTAWELGILGGAILLGLCATPLGYHVVDGRGDRRRGSGSRLLSGPPPAGLRASGPIARPGGVSAGRCARRSPAGARAGRRSRRRRP
jgi:MFS family permease